MYVCKNFKKIYSDQGEGHSCSIKNWFGDMTVEMSTGRGEAGDIICKTVVRVVQSCIQV